MAELLFELPFRTAEISPNATALVFKQQNMTYSELAIEIRKVANGLIDLGLQRSERVGIYLPKRFENVTSFFGAVYAGGVFVPINPLLKPEQVEYIQRDCNVRITVTSNDRLAQLAPSLKNCPDLHTVIVLDADESAKFPDLGHVKTVTWNQFINNSDVNRVHRVIDSDMAAILYTSGSTGKPKGVVLSHKNMVTGAKSVSTYLENNANDRLLAVLPFSFDYGFSQLSTAFNVGASVVLLNYLLPKDVINAVSNFGITGLAGVPPLWVQLSTLEWSEASANTLRYITNSGGAMPGAALAKLRKSLPTTKPYLMYGLTEAFRSTYLPPEEVDRRPESMGKAIPNAEIMVVREDGSPCAPGEPGELVHRGPLVSLGYWNDTHKTGERFKPVPNPIPGLVLTELAVWSGDTVKMDEEGFLYFIGRKDDMIKTSGYRVSPTEVEEVIYSTGLVGEAVALGIAHPQLGQAITIVATKGHHEKLEEKRVIDACKMRLPNFMVPQKIIERDSLPRNQNGKIDRKMLTDELRDLYQP